MEQEGKPTWTSQYIKISDAQIHELTMDILYTIVLNGLLYHNM